MSVGKGLEKIFSEEKSLFKASAIIKIIFFQKIDGKPIEIQNKTVVIQGLLCRASVIQDLVFHFLFKEGKALI